MLDRAQEAVGVAEPGRVLAAYVPLRRQGRERGQCRRIAQRLVRPAVYELEQLDGELDVAQAARTELDLPAGVLGWQVRDDPAPHRTDVIDEVVAAGRLPHERLECVDVVLA